MGGGISSIPFTPNSSCIASNTLVVEKGEKVYITGEIVSNNVIAAGDTIVSGLPAPSSAVTVVNGLYKGSDNTNLRKLTVDTSGNLKLASDQSGMAVATWYLTTFYSV